MIKVLAIDDEPAALKTLQLMMARYVPAIDQIQICSNPSEAIKTIATFQPDLVFLDIQMPLINGFEVLQQMETIPFEVIFCTAYDQYAIQAIRFSALDYLLKPLDAEELQLAVQRFINKKDKKKSDSLLYTNLLNNLKAPSLKDFRLAINNSDGTFFYKPQEIVRLEAESNYTRFFFTEHRPLIVAKTMKEYEELLLPHGFVRAHKSHLVNSRHVVSVTSDGQLIMLDKTKVEISRRRKDEVMHALKT